MHPQVVARTRTDRRDRHGQTGGAGKLEAGDGRDRAVSVIDARWQVRVRTCKRVNTPGGPRQHTALPQAFPPARASATGGTAEACLSSMVTG